MTSNSTTLRRGSQGAAVTELQCKLNLNVSPGPQLTPDGIFGPKTEAAVIAFQKANKLTPDGIVGPLTQAELNKGPAVTYKIWPIKHQAQPTNTTCWATSTAMMNSTTVPLVIAKTPNDMIASDGGLLNSSESDQAVVTGQRYGDIHGFRCHAPMSWSVGGFVNAIKRSPLMIDMLWRSSDYTAGKGSPGHMVVVAGVISDGNPTGMGTLVYVLDPWAPHVGKKSWETYYNWVNDVPTRTYRVFERK
jgi:peptidoglycan hydrolase-like protein with peptidoglycan-binding domain